MSTAVELTMIGPGSAGILLSAEEFDSIAESEEGYCYELIQGVLVVTPIPSEKEASPNETLGGLLFVYHEQHPLGSNLDLTLPERYIATREGRRRADRVIWAGLGRRPDPRSETPTIAVEFVSEGKRNWFRDYAAKRVEYLELGMAEYWLVDRFSRVMQVYRNSPQGAVEIVVSEGETYRTPLLPGFELPLSRLLEAADAWNDPA